MPVQSASESFRLVRRERPPASPPRLDDAQYRVVRHRGGPLLVLAGPGTGKTTTIVEHVVDRVQRDGLDPARVLLLTFSRRAAAELRDRVTSRLGRTVRDPVARTFHSYAYGLLRREAVLRGEPAPRLLSGPEQDLLIRDLLRGDVEEFGARSWPEPLRPALLTRGFAQELRDLLLRAAERGVRPGRLRAHGRRLGREVWLAVADFAEQYSAVTALRTPPAYDPAELVRAAVGLLSHDRDLLDAERDRRGVVVVDEYQDTDPAQEALLHLLAGGGRDLLVVGDPDQSIYAFRGADVDGIRRFTDRFRRSDGQPAAVEALRTSRRCGPVLVAASRRVAGRLGGPVAHRDLGTETFVAHGRGEVEVHLVRSASEEAAFVAQRLREAHLLDGIPWSRMAVLVRGAHPLPVLRRALQTAGVPVAVRLDELPLAGQPVVRALLDVLASATDRRPLDPETATALVTGPLGGADPWMLRRLRQELRRHELDTGGTRGSAALLTAALERPEDLAALRSEAVRPARVVADLLGAARVAAAAPGATAEDVLWAVWRRSGLGERWARTAVRGGPGGAAADRDLDAVVALFEVAARFVDRLPGEGPAGLLDHLAGQEVPADSLAPRAPDGAAVTLLTAHAAKGLEWDIVAVTGVQEGTWPDLRPRGSLLGSELLVDLEAARDRTPGARASALLAEERRLFYVAVTRARRRLVVTAVNGEDAQPSRFLDELLPWRGNGDERPLTRAPRSLDLAALVAELRAVACESGAADVRRRDAAHHLALLARSGIPGADPDSWYALPDLTDDQPLCGADQPVRVSPSKVEAFHRCGLRWLLEACGGAWPSGATREVGRLVHGLAEHAAAGVRGGELLDRFEELWPQVEAGAGWAGRREHDRARRMVERLATWLDRPGARDLAGAEVDFEVRVGRALLAGRVDRLERDRDGRLVVVDIKTGKSRPRRTEVERHAQLGAYQAAVATGAFPQGAEPGGASLLQLGDKAADRGAEEQLQSPPAATDDPEWALRLLAEATDGMAGATFAAAVNSLCATCSVRTSCPAVDEGRQVVP